MRLSYDPTYNIGYLRFHEKSGPVTTLKISEEMNIGIAPDGTVYGIEILMPMSNLLKIRVSSSWNGLDNTGRSCCPLNSKPSPGGHGRKPIVNPRGQDRHDAPHGAAAG